MATMQDLVELNEDIKKNGSNFRLTFDFLVEFMVENPKLETTRDFLNWWRYDENEKDMLSDKFVFYFDRNEWVHKNDCKKWDKFVTVKLSGDIS